MSKSSFQIGDYVIHDDYGVVIHIKSHSHADVVNAVGGYRSATQLEKEQYHDE